MSSLKNGPFWVAELVDSLTSEPFAPAIYWNGETRIGFDPVTTADIHAALKFRDAATCQNYIDRLDLVKRGVFKPTEHEFSHR